MTVFTATQPVALTATTMNGIFSFLTSNPKIEIANGNEFKLENASHTIEVDFRGSFHLNPFTHIPDGGTLTSVQINEPAGVLAYSSAAWRCH